MFGAFGFFDQVGHWLTEWWAIMQAYGAAGLWIAGLVAAAVLIPRLDFRVRVALIVIAGVIVLTTIAFTVGIKKGAARVEAKQDFQLGQEAHDGEQLRDNAHAAVRAEPPSVRNESPWNRDNWHQ